MANPILSHLIKGKVRDRLGNILEGATVTITHASITPSISKNSNSKGEYIINLSKLSSQWSKGDSITITASKTAKGSITTTTTIKNLGGQTENLTLEETSDLSFYVNPRDVYNLNFALLTTYDGNKVTFLNPLPVGISNQDGVQVNPARKEDIETISNQFQKTAFDELSVAEASPVNQVQFPYNINTDIWETRDNGGTASVVNNMANLSTGSGTNQSSTLLTKTPIKYNPGQGALTRFTGIFTTGVANSVQYIGIGDKSDGFFFGFNGATFGILRRQGGKPETRRLAITTASNAGEDLTITLNGVAETVTVTAAGADSTTTRVVTANDIVAHTNWKNVGEGWEVHNMGPNVFFTSFTDGAKSGTYSISGPDTGDGTFSQSLAGVSTTETIINQTDWNTDKFNGTGVSGITFNPDKGNVFQIRYQWLGFGGIQFFIEDGVDSKLHLVHSIRYANNNIVPSIDNPTLPLYIESRNSSNISDIIVKVGSMGGFVEGRDTLPGLPHAINNTVTGISNTETPILTIHPHDIYQSTLNRVKIKMISSNISIEGTKTSIIRIRKNAVITGPVSFSALDSDISTIRVDTTATGISGGTVVFSTGAAKLDKILIDLEKLGITLAAPDYLTLTVEGTAVTSIEAVAGFNWQELF